MASSINRVTILGNLGADPEMRTINTGSSVTTLSIATTESYKDKAGNWQDTTEWHRVTLWDRLAERASQYLRKGSKVYIEGKLKYRSYEKDGITRYVTDIQANSMILLDKREQGGDFTATSNYGGGQNSGGNSDSYESDTDFDDDVPF
ncbi:MAG: single-stranded DNA-binding protein [Candidatus Kapaibacteriales bacterium]